MTLLEGIEYIQNNTKKSYENNIPTIIKPIHKNNEKYKVDPIILDIIKQKSGMKKGFSLHFERNRLDKIANFNENLDNYVEEKLIKFDNYSINSFRFNTINSSDKIIIFFHGGGYIAGKIEYYYNQCVYLAKKTNSCVIFPEYRLAPENPYPAAIDDAKNVLEWAKRKNKKIVLVGDSAGAGLINALIYDEKLKGGKSIDLAIELYPASDIFQIENDTYTWSIDQYTKVSDNEKIIYDRILKLKNSSALYKKLYLTEEKGFKNPDISSNYWDNYQGLPKLVVISAEFDFLRISNEIFVQNCLEAGNDIKYIKYLGCDHGFLDYFGKLPQSEEVLITISNEINLLDY